jgi:hypothetical protein
LQYTGRRINNGLQFAISNNSSVAQVSQLLLLSSAIVYKSTIVPADVFQMPVHRNALSLAPILRHIHLSRLLLILTISLGTIATSSCKQPTRDKDVNPDNLDSVVLVQVTHPYLGNRLASKQLDKKLFRDFLNDFVDKQETVVKFYSCYVIKLYFKQGGWVSYRTNGQLFEKLKDEYTNGVYFTLNNNINLVTKYWHIPQDKFCDTIK